MTLLSGRTLLNSGGGGGGGATDAQLRDRGTHTGAQAISTVTGLQTALDAKAATSVTDALDTRLDAAEARPSFLLIDNVGALPPGTPAGVVVVVKE